MKNSERILVAILATVALTGGQTMAQESAEKTDRELPSFAQITSDSEPGILLEVNGTVYYADGKTPAPGIMVYVYHTDASGIYAPREAGFGAHRLNAEMVTDENGRYGYKTIKPASYPESTVPSHIHYRVTPPGSTQPIHFNLEFEGDPHIRKAELTRERTKGIFASIVPVVRDKDGVLQAEYNLRLPINR